MLVLQRIHLPTVTQHSVEEFPGGYRMLATSNIILLHCCTWASQYYFNLWFLKSDIIPIILANRDSNFHVSPSRFRGPPSEIVVSLSVPLASQKSSKLQSIQKSKVAETAGRHRSSIHRTSSLVVLLHMLLFKFNTAQQHHTNAHTWQLHVSSVASPINSDSYSIFLWFATNYFVSRPKIISVKLNFYNGTQYRPEILPVMGCLMLLMTSNFPQQVATSAFWQTYKIPKKKS